MNGQCQGCWWKEGGRCYNESFAHITKDEKGFRLGQPITDQDLLDECLAFHGRQGKREVLERVIPGDKLVILSEGRSA